MYDTSTHTPVPHSPLPGTSSSTPNATPKDRDKPEAGAEPESSAWSGPHWDTDIDMPDAGAQHSAALPSGSIGELLYSL